MCRGEWPAADHLIRAGGLADLYLHDDQFFAGWSVLVLKRHATELFELTEAERHGLIDEAASVAHALCSAFHAVKINYELLGNQLPHVHWHLIPRLADDPAPRAPVWTVAHEPKRLAGDELQAMIDRLRRHLR
jgi:diadenosine tetraphosphate (Ap4A) HIT family hydrolase